MQNIDLSDRELKRAKNAAYRLLAARSRSKHELEQKLEQRGFSRDIISNVIVCLHHLGYLDDLMFAAQWAASRVRNKNYGRRRIEQELHRKGISRETACEALASAVSPEDERSAANKAAEKKLRTMHGLDSAAKKRRLAGFLERKGFSAEIVRDVLMSVEL